MPSQPPWRDVHAATPHAKLPAPIHFYDAVRLRAARALLDWSRADFGISAGISPETIRNIETARFEPAAETVRKITLAFAAEGIGLFDQLGGYRVAGVFLRQAGNDNDSAAAGQQASEAFALANRMADAIADRIRTHGQCRPRDLEKMGFSREEIAEFWSLASALAAVEGPGQ